MRQRRSVVLLLLLLLVGCAPTISLTEMRKVRARAWNAGYAMGWTDAKRDTVAWPADSVWVNGDDFKR